MKQATLEALQVLRAGHQPAVVVSAVDGSFQTLLDGTMAHRAGDALPVADVDLLKHSARAVLRTDASRIVSTAAGNDVFVQAFNPPLRMVIIGAVHIAQSLAPMGVLAGYDVVVVDPRRSFAADARFPGVSMHKIWPDDALDALRPDARTAIVTLTHDPKIDDPALHVALRTDAFYIGCLGSRRTHAQRVERLEAAGFSEADIARIHAPVGLDIGARSPAEIAVSTLAQVTEALRKA